MNVSTGEVYNLIRLHLHSPNKYHSVFISSIRVWTQQQQSLLENTFTWISLISSQGFMGYFKSQVISLNYT